MAWEHGSLMPDIMPSNKRLVIAQAANGTGRGIWPARPKPEMKTAWRRRVRCSSTKGSICGEKWWREVVRRQDGERGGWGERVNGGSGETSGEGVEGAWAKGVRGAWARRGCGVRAHISHEPRCKLRRDP